MASRSSHNKNNSAVKRILQEAKELGNDPSTDYCAAPLEDDIFEWHGTIRGPADTEFEGGLYHCRILLPSEYPFKPPNIMLLTPNGRFELNKKICISFTAYHEDLWQPAWGIRTAIVGLQGFFPIRGEAAMGIGALDYPAAERKRLATLSRDWVCPECGVSNKELLPDVRTAEAAAEGTARTSSADVDHPHLHTTESAPASSTPPAEPSLVPKPDDASAQANPPESVPEASIPSAPAAPVQLLQEHAPAAPAQPSLSTPVTAIPEQVIPPRPAAVRLEPLPSRPPLFLDGLIVALVAIMAYILAKKVGVHQAIMAAM